MRKAIILLLLLSFCSSGSDSTSDEPTQSASSIEELIYEDANGNLVNEDLTNKKTLVVFWADY
jgi:ABC-type Fe3+-hydroxamate transport system substrate-binding protein